MTEHALLEASGQVIAMLRKAAGLTQRQLADRAHVSLSLLQKVEIGDRRASHALLAAMVRALRVPIERLSGQPYTDSRTDERVHRDIDALRAVLRCYDLPDEVRIRPLDELATDVETLARHRAAADYGKLAARLPGLLEELTAAAHHVDTAHVQQANALLVSAYHAAHALTYRLGYPDLAESIEHKLAYAAERTGDPLAGGLAQWARAQSFQAAGDYQHGLRLMAGARERLDDVIRSRRPTPAALRTELVPASPLEVARQRCSDQAPGWAWRCRSRSGLAPAEPFACTELVSAWPTGHAARDGARQRNTSSRGAHRADPGDGARRAGCGRLGLGGRGRAPLPRTYWYTLEAHPRLAMAQRHP